MFLTQFVELDPTDPDLIGKILYMLNAPDLVLQQTTELQDMRIDDSGLDLIVCLPIALIEAQQQIIHQRTQDVMRITVEHAKFLPDLSRDIIEFMKAA